MTLLGLLRHAHAGDPGKWAGRDDARPLSDKGRRQAERLGRHLAAMDEPPSILITSPKLRARETAGIVGDLVGAPVAVDPRLGGPLDLAIVDRVLADAGDPDRPVLVGHDPDFSELLGALVGTGPLTMRKGGYALVDVGRPLTFGRGTLRVLLPPDHVPDC